MKKSLFLSVICFVLFISNSGYAAPWKPINTNGYGDTNNFYCTSMTTYNNVLYVGTYNFTSGCELWTYNGATSVQVNINGFGNINNEGIYAMVEYGGFLYVGTFNANGSRVLRTMAVGGPPYTDWTEVSSAGFGNPNNQGVYTMFVYKNDLYAGTYNKIEGGEVWRTAAVGGPPFTDWVKVNASGFGDIRNEDLYSIGVFNGYLYVTTYNGTTGGEIWRTAATGGPPYTDWTQVNTDGFGDANNAASFCMISHNNNLYVGTFNAVTGGQVWRTAAVGGPPYTDWTKVNTNGFGDLNNWSVDSLAVYDNNLYAGTLNFITGGEVWKTAAVGSPPFPDWSQVNADGFGSIRNEDIYTLHAYNGYLYAGVYNTLTGSQVWQFPEFINVPVNVPTMNEWGMILLVVLLGLLGISYLRKYRNNCNF